VKSQKRPLRSFLWKLCLTTLVDQLCVIAQISALKLRSNNRGAFVPPEGTSPSDIQKLWDALLAAERERDDALRKELERQERLDVLNRRFKQKADKLEAWIATKEKYLEKEETVDSLNSAKERLKFHETFYDEYDASKARLHELEVV